MSRSPEASASPRRNAGGVAGERDVAEGGPGEREGHLAGIEGRGGQAGEEPRGAAGQGHPAQLGEDRAVDGVGAGEIVPLSLDPDPRLGLGQHGSSFDTGSPGITP